MAVVRAKVYVASYKINSWGGTTIEFQAATKGEPNKEWSAATPQLNLTMTVKNEVAAEVFRDRIGQDFWLDFTPVPVDDPT